MMELICLKKKSEKNIEIIGRIIYKRFFSKDK